MFNTIAALIVSNALLLEAYALTCVCTNATHYAPVCASDGKVYRNSKLLYCYNRCNNWSLSILPYETCSLRQSECACPNTAAHAPVCASDGRSYANNRAIECHNLCNNRQIYILFDGVCPRNGCICTGTRVESQVCGSDGRTYRNPATVRCLNVCQRKNIQIAFNGPCSRAAPIDIRG